MKFGAAMVPHVACEYAPVRRKVDLEQSCHPVSLIIFCGQVLEFETARKLRSPLVKEVCHEDVGKTDISACIVVVFIIILRRVQKLLQRRKAVYCADFHFIDGSCVFFDILQAAVTQQVSNYFYISSVL